MQPEIRKLARNGKGLKIAVPTHFTRVLGWHIGDHIYLRVNQDDTVTLARVDAPTIDNLRHGAPA